jgi:hypothetical protein
MVQKSYVSRTSEQIKRAVREQDLGAAIELAVEEAKLAYKFAPSSHSMGCLTVVLHIRAMYKRRAPKA